MKIIIVGNGISGQTVAQGLRQKDDVNEIIMISGENHPYYSRIFLPNYISGERSKEDLYQRKIDWYSQKKIQLLVDTVVEHIDLKTHEVSLDKGRNPIEYDKLILAIGSSPRKIPFGNPNVKGLFTLRTIADADRINAYIKENGVKRAFIIGGGLLGIELGFHIQKMGIKVVICEIFPYLLPRQLDKESSQLLKNYLEKQGLEFILGKSVKKIIGSPSIESIEMESGEIIPTQLVMEQLGIIPNIELAKNSGLNTEKGIIVNNFMQTNDPDVYAAGDCIQFGKQIWGIIPASMEQAKLVTAHILGESPTPYNPSVWHTKLKIAGLDLTSVGS
ncbi:MAG: NAD(P)/FAD-dependent oxidoreductase, partial [Promethearchaeota archaeon]